MASTQAALPAGKTARARFPRLEQKNFRVDSRGWETAAGPLAGLAFTNPSGDVAELSSGPFAGEQFFTLEAAVRATEAAGKRMPTETEWFFLVLPFSELPSRAERWRTWRCWEGWTEAPKAAAGLGLPLAGYLVDPVSALLKSGAGGGYWCAPSHGSACSHAFFSPFGMRSLRGDYGRFMLSVRCLAEP